MIATLLRAYWKPLAVVAAVSVMFLALKLYGQIQYQRGRNDAQLDYAIAALKDFKEQVNRLTGLSERMETAADELRAAEPKIIERFTRVEVKNPLPADCVIPADGLRDINDAIGAANAARQSVKAMPRNPAAGK